MVFAELAGAYWLSQDGAQCQWCTELFSQQSGQEEQPGMGTGLDSRMLRLRLAILPIAVLTVTAAVIVGRLG